MRSSTVQQAALLTFVILTVWFSFYIIQPPEPKKQSAAKTTFSAERAFTHVQKIAQAIHPLGTAANDSVRSYIINELNSMGLEPTVQEGVGTSSRFGGGLAGYTKNIFAKIQGQNPEHTILLMAHYDSTPTTLGAADDGSGVAAILEAVRAIQSQNTPLKNNIWILITDGEERGLLGAELFTDEFTELEQIDLVLNFEARGSSGASMMFETSSPNSKLIPHFAEATPDPVANSLMYTVYKLLPNDTDLSIIKQAGLNGFNFAFAEDFLNYHTMQDNPQNLSRASLQHHGTNLLGNVRHFGNIDINFKSNSEYVYFNNATGGLIYYPSGWSFPLAVVAALLFIAYLIFLFRTDRLSIGSYLGSIGLFLGITAIGAAVTYFGWQGIKLLHPEFKWLAQSEVYTHRWYLWGFTLLTIGTFGSLYGMRWIQKKLTAQKLLAGSYTIWILLSLGTAWYLPTASYFFTWPALMGLIGWVALGDEITNNSWRATALLALSLSGALFLVPPYVYLIQVMMTTELLAISMVLLILTLGIVWPLLWRIIQTRKTVWNSVLIIAALAYFVIASANTGFDSQHKKQNDMNYVQNLNTNQAYWISRDPTIDSWTRQFLGKKYQKGEPSVVSFFGDNVLYKNAPVQKIATPKFDIQGDSTADSLRYISLRIDTQNDGLGMHINWEKEDLLEEVTLDGKQIYSTRSLEDNSSESLSDITYFKDLSEPTKLNLTFKNSAEAPELTFSFIKIGLPTEMISQYAERPSDMMPIPSWISNSSIWQTSVKLDTLTVGK